MKKKMITIPNKNYKQRVKYIKKMYNEEQRCLMCEGTFARVVGGFGSPLSMLISDDNLKFYLEDNDKKEIIGEIRVNFCPYCGRQIREEVDWNLCD